MENYWGDVFETEAEDIDEQVKSNLIELSYTLGVVNDEATDTELPDDFFQVSEKGGYAPEAGKFMEQMKEALEINLRAMGIEEEELRNTVDTQKSLLDKVVALETMLKEVKVRDSAYEQEKLYNELQSEIQTKFEKFEKQMQETQDRIIAEKERQNNEEEIERLQKTLQSLEEKMEAQTKKMLSLQEEREQRKLDELAEKLAREREIERQKEVAKIKQQLIEDEERRMEKDKRVYEQLVAMESRLRETETVLQSTLTEKETTEKTPDPGMEEMQRYLQQMERRFAEEERRKAEELKAQEEKIKQLEAALMATQNQLEREKMTKKEAPQINLDGNDIMGTIEQLMAKMMGSKMTQLESKVKNLESRAISGGGPVRDYEAIKKEMEDLQAILFDPDTPDSEIKRINIEFEKLMAEYERTPEYQEELLRQKNEWNEINGPLNDDALLDVKSKLLTLQSTNKQRYIEKVKGNPLMKIIVLDKQQILSKHANDFKILSFGDTKLKHLRALYAALPDFRNDQTVQLTMVENIKAKIDELVTNPKPKRKKVKPMAFDPNGPPPPPPPMKNIVNTAPPPNPGDLFGELLARRQRL